MDKKSFLQAGHTPTLIAAFLYFDLAFMVWVLSVRSVSASPRTSV